MRNHETPAFTDIHCHLLPGIDDGAVSWNDSLQMAKQAVGEGILTAIMTPHQLGNYTHNTGEQIRALTDEFQRRLLSAGIPLQVLPGADVRIDSDMLDRIASGDCLTLGDTRKYVLLELPHELYLPLEPVLEQLSACGITGILSHPERNKGILRQPDVVRRLVSHGCLMQVTADSLTGVFGPAPEQLSRTLIQQGLVHFLATDAHSPRSRRPRMRDAMQLATEIAGEEYARAICCTNPAAVAAGTACPPLPVPLERGFFSRLFARRAA